MLLEAIYVHNVDPCTCSHMAPGRHALYLLQHHMSCTAVAIEVCLCAGLFGQLLHTLMVYKGRQGFTSRLQTPAKPSVQSPRQIQLGSPQLWAYCRGVIMLKC